MYPRNRDIGHSDLALVASSESHRHFFIRRYHMKVSFLELLSSFMFVCDTLEDYVWLVGFVEGYHV
jgi:hypothetical protein